MKNSHVIPTGNISDKRQEAKAKRKRGLKYLSSVRVDPVVHGQKHDPLFQVKGIKRHKMLKNI